MDKKRNEREIGFDAIDVLAEVPVKPDEVIPLNIEKALECYSEAERKEIMELSEHIDVKKVENLMNYGSSALVKTFEQCGQFLKSESGSSADQEIIKKVVELSRKAGETYEDFNMVLKEPNLFQKLLLSFSEGARKSRKDKIQQSAISNYKLLVQLKNSCDEWIEMLKDSMGEIEYSGISDIEQITLLEKYLIAGGLAEKRIRDELSDSMGKYQETGTEVAAQKYQTVKEGYDIFQVVMANLEKSRVMYKLSIGQLALIKKSNRNVQIAIRTQENNSMALLAQQLRNAVLNAKTKEVLEGQKAINHLNEELIKEVSKSVGLTAEETEKLLYSSFYNMQVAKQAIETVVKTCANIEKVATDMLPKMHADLAEIDQLMKDLDPAVEKIAKSSLNEETSETPNGDNEENSGLKF